MCLIFRGKEMAITHELAYVVNLTSLLPKQVRQKHRSKLL